MGTTGFLVFLLGFSHATKWKQLPNVDNYGYDIKSAGTTNVSLLQARCEELIYCAGFSSAFGLLKFNVSAATLGVQPNTVLYVRDPPPPAVPIAPPHLPWPLPSFVSPAVVGSSTTPSLGIDNATFDFAMAAGSAPSQVLADALVRYRVMLFPVSPSSPASTTAVPATAGDSVTPAMLLGCDVHVASADEELALGVDESYELHIPDGAAGSGRASLRSATVWGALRGLATFAQLLTFASHAELAAGRGTVVGGGGSAERGGALAIVDAPRFAYRGLMIDSARHFQPVEVLLAHLELMEAAKLNVLHWHISDGQAFPFNSSAHPLLSALASYDAERATYSHDDVRRIVAFARARGIRVIPEFDLPAHDESWTVGYPHLSGSSAGTAVDPTLEANYDFVEALVAEIAPLFPDEILHVGCDELVLDHAWNTSAIRAWMARNLTNPPITTLPELEGYWLARLTAIGERHNKTLMFWHDPVANGAPIPANHSGGASTATVEVWGGDLAFADGIATAHGVKVVYAAPFYLDNVGKQWDDFYGGLFGGGLVTALDANFVGGEAAMWAEWVDETNAIARVWPRAAAVAEALWAPANGTNPLLAGPSAHRLAQWRCRMRARGLGVEPVGALGGGPFYCKPDAVGWEANFRRPSAAARRARAVAQRGPARGD
eukprot:g3061.t1